MPFRFTLYDNPPSSSTTQRVWKNIICGTITSFTGDLNIVERRIGDVTIKVIEDVILNVRGEDALTSVVQGSDNIVQYPSTSYVDKYTAGKLKIPVTGYRYQASLGHWVSRAGIEDPEYDGTVIFSHSIVDSNDEYTSGRIDAFVYAYELTYDGENYIYFSTFKISESSSITGYGISVNAFEGAATPRFTPPTEPDDEGGYGTGSTPSGNQDGSVINVDVGGDTVNVAPPDVAVSVGVQVNMPETNAPTINHPPGINIALVSNAALGALNDALWGRNQQGFNDLWLQFQNYSYNPMQGIISCIKLPYWVIYELNQHVGSDSNIAIAGTTIGGFTGKLVGTGACVEHTFQTGPITQFNTFQDFVGVTIRAYAPFVGWFDIDPSLCLGVSNDNTKCIIEFVYRVDVTNGNIGVQIWATTTGKSDTQAHKAPIANGSGNCAYPVLLASNDRGISDVVGGFTQMFGGAVSTAAGVAAENPLLAVSGLASSVGGTMKGLFPQQHTTTVGGISGSVGYLNYIIPFVQVIKPRYVKPDKYDVIYGRPSYADSTVSDFAGHWAKLEVHIKDIDFANKEEQQMIINALAKGVYV